MKYTDWTTGEPIEKEWPTMKTGLQPETPTPGGAVVRAEPGKVTLLIAVAGDVYEIGLTVETAYGLAEELAQGALVAAGVDPAVVADLARHSRPT